MSSTHETAKQKVNTEAKEEDTGPESKERLALPGGLRDSTLARVRTVAYSDAKDKKQYTETVNRLSGNTAQCGEAYSFALEMRERFQRSRHSEWSGTSLMEISKGKTEHSRWR